MNRVFGELFTLKGHVEWSARFLWEGLPLSLSLSRIAGLGGRAHPHPPLRLGPSHSHKNPNSQQCGEIQLRPDVHVYVCVCGAGPSYLTGGEKTVTWKSRALRQRGGSRQSVGEAGWAGESDGLQSVVEPRAKLLEASTHSALHGLSVWLGASLIMVDEQRRMFSL